MDSVSNVGVVDKTVAVLPRARSGRAGGASASCRSPPACRGRPPTAWPRRSSSTAWSRRDPDGRFCLGLGLVALGRAAADGFPLAELARPALAALRDETGESVQLFVREGDGRRCVVSLQSAHGLRWIVAEGALVAARPRFGRQGADRGDSDGPVGSRASRSASRAWRRSARRLSTVAVRSCRR